MAGKGDARGEMGGREGVLEEEGEVQGSGRCVVCVEGGRREGEVRGAYRGGRAGGREWGWGASGGTCGYARRGRAGEAGWEAKGGVKQRKRTEEGQGVPGLNASVPQVVDGELARRRGRARERRLGRRQQVGEPEPVRGRLWRRRGDDGWRRARRVLDDMVGLLVLVGLVEGVLELELVRVVCVHRDVGRRGGRADEGRAEEGRRAVLRAGAVHGVAVQGEGRVGVPDELGARAGRLVEPDVGRAVAASRRGRSAHRRKRAGREERGTMDAPVVVPVARDA